MADIDISIIVTGLFCLIVLYILFRLLYYPLRYVFRLLLQAMGGLLILIIFNFLASFWDITIGVNVFTGLLVGIMGLPGLVMLVCLQLIL